MRVVRTSALALLALYLSIHLTIGGAWNESITYNAVAAAAIVAVLLAPNISDAIAKPMTATAMASWLAGSLIASSALFDPSRNQLISNIFYLLFYPFALIGLPRLLAANRKLTLVELADASIFGLGLSVLGSAFALKPLMPHFDGDPTQTFFAIMYPVADLILISVVATSVSLQGISRRGALLCCGTLLFSLTDFFYLLQHIQGSYTAGSLLDAGWLLAIVLIAESFYHPGIDGKATDGINPILISISVSLSATLLALIAIRPEYFPRIILFPAVTTLLLAFARMAIALNQARSIGQERLLARTDELTGLPNRRRLISEIENFVQKQGALMLLDLDGFKPINDQHGHETGDKVLQQVALRFERALPNGALLARLGGDEFGVLYEGGHDSAVEVALALRATLSYPFHINNHEIKLGVSIGVAKNNGEKDLLVRADNAMYKAKREGLGVYRL